MKMRLERLLVDHAGTIAFAILLAGGVLVAIALLGSERAGAGGEAPAQGAKLRETIATARSNDFRVKLTATAPKRMSFGTVRIKAYERDAGGWQQVGRALRVGRRWFWPSVTNRFGVPRFTIATGGKVVSMTVAVRLPTSQEGDVSPPFRFAIHEGRFFQIDV